MENRYPEDNFTWWYNALGGEGENTYQTFEIIMHSEKFPDAAIHAARWKKDGEFIYADNYMAYCLEDDVNAYMHKIAEDCFGECKVYVHFSYGKLVSSAFPTNATAEDYLKSKPGCSIAIYLAPEGRTKAEAQENLNMFQDKLTKKQFYDVSGGVRIISDQAAYDGITSFVSYLDGLDRSIVDYVGGFEVK